VGDRPLGLEQGQIQVLDRVLGSLWHIRDWLGGRRLDEPPWQAIMYGDPVGMSVDPSAEAPRPPAAPGQTASDRIDFRVTLTRPRRLVGRLLGGAATELASGTTELPLPTNFNGPLEARVRIGGGAIGAATLVRRFRVEAAGLRPSTLEGVSISLPPNTGEQVDAAAVVTMAASWGRAPSFVKQFSYRWDIRPVRRRTHRDQPVTVISGRGEVSYVFGATGDHEVEVTVTAPDDPSTAVAHGSRLVRVRSHQSPGRTQEQWNLLTRMGVSAVTVAIASVVAVALFWTDKGFGSLRDYMAVLGTGLGAEVGLGASGALLRTLAGALGAANKGGSS
jgi:hypothetical protein